MKRTDIHRWDVTTEEATAIQLNLAGQVSHTNGISEKARYVVGINISPPDDDGKAYGAAVVMCVPDLQVARSKTRA